MRLAAELLIVNGESFKNYFQFKSYPQTMHYFSQALSINVILPGPGREGLSLSLIMCELETLKFDIDNKRFRLRIRVTVSTNVQN